MVRIAGVAVVSLLAAACASSRKSPAPARVPVGVEYPWPVHVFRGLELEEMRARSRLAGVTYGTGCFCMPIYVVHGDEPEGTNLRGPHCANTSLAPEDSPKCFGLDPHGIEQEGRYLCREWKLGPAIRSTTGADTLQ